MPPVSSDVFPGRCPAAFPASARFVLSLLAVALLASTAPARTPTGEVESPPAWDVLPVEEVGALTFRRAHPGWDGTGVVVGILDSGVDLGVSGLDRLPDGSRKILDARDFSGQGDVKLARATFDTRDGRPVLVDRKDRVVFGVERLAATSPDSTYWLGFLEEKAWRLSSVKDLNGNGSQDDRFAVLAFAPVAGAADSQWVALVDLDADGQLDDESPIRGFGFSGDLVRFRSSTDGEKLHALNGGLTIRPAERLVELHLADNGHGTHVAGIAAGFRLGGQAGLDGVAPGANVLSLKIGNNSLVGGATTTGSVKRALEWAAEWAKERSRPLVLNMSYGIESELDGLSDVDRLIDDFLLENPRVVFVCSAGNNGPGLSSVGTPSAAGFALTTGNMIPDSGAPEIWGSGVRRDLLNYGSSRGGEVAKPDIIAPGVALSTVPPFDNSEIKNGTSMAAPHAAGVVALLLSAARAEGIDWNWATVRQALRGTARPLPGFSALDQGAGLIDVNPAWTALRDVAPRASESLLAVRVEATNPFYPSGTGPAAFWRSGGWFPSPPRDTKVTIRGAFRKDATPDQRVDVLRAWDLETDVPWLRLDRSSVHLKGEDATTIDVEYDPAALRSPGVYTGRIRAVRRGGPGPRLVEWESWHTVVVPNRFPHADGTLSFTASAEEPGAVRRHFVEVPAGASALRVRVEAERGSRGQARAIVFDPEGHGAGAFGGYADPVTGARHEQTVTGARLVPGTWEVVVYSNLANRHDAAWRLDLEVTGFDCRPDTLRRFVHEAGKRPAATATVTNLFGGPFEGRAVAQLLGWRRERTIRVTDQDRFEIPVSMAPETAEVTFEVEFDDALYNRATDLVLGLLDEKGIPKQRASFDNRRGTLTVPNPNGPGGAPAAWRLEIWPGFTHGESKEAWSFRLVETHRRRTPDTVRVTQAGNETLALYPGVPAEVRLELDDAPRQAPDGANPWGEVRFEDSATKATRGTWPILLESGR
jgi:tripeptidyl-peptidase-2